MCKNRAIVCQNVVETKRIIFNTKFSKYKKISTEITAGWAIKSWH
jgi:hypothetical protein